jgi:tetratricopeptide (TPR) repeat protein
MEGGTLFVQLGPGHNRDLKRIGLHGGPPQGGGMSIQNSEEYEDRGIELLFSGKAEAALSAFDAGLRKFPQDQGLLLGRGMALNDLKRPVEAREIFVGVIAANPNLTDALQGLVVAEISLGNYQAAAVAARKACDNPGESSAEFVHELGLMLYQQGLFSDAEYCYRRAVAIDRTHGHSWIGLASCLHHQGRRDDAIAALKEAVEDWLPGFWEAYSYLGCLLFDAGRSAEAEAFLGKIPLDELRDPAAAQRLKSFLDAEKHPERARVLAIIESRAREQLKMEALAVKPAKKPQPTIIVIGNIHGNLKRIIEPAHHAKLLGWDNSWIAGPTITVQTGNVIDRGYDSVCAYENMDALQTLRASKAGGTVIRLVGCHELRVLKGDFSVTDIEDPTSFQKKLQDDILCGKVQWTFASQGYLFSHAGVRKDVLRMLVGEGSINRASDAASLVAGEMNRLLIAAIKSGDWAHPIFQGGIGIDDCQSVGDNCWEETTELILSSGTVTVKQILGHHPEEENEGTTKFVGPIQYLRIRNGKIRAFTIGGNAPPPIQTQREAKDQATAGDEPFEGTFLVGPVRGDYDNLVKILRHAELIDEGGKWLGRAAALVVIGPFLGKGRGKLKALRYLEKLQRQVGRLKSRASVCLVASPHEDIGPKHEAALCVDARWLITSTGISAPALAVAASAVRNRWRGGGPWRPPFTRELVKEICAKPEHLDGKPELGANGLEAFFGQVCVPTEWAGVHAQSVGSSLTRLDSGLGDGWRLLYLRSQDEGWGQVELPLAQDRFVKFKKGFSENFGIEFPPACEPDQEREPIDPESDGSLFVSGAVRKAKALVPVFPDTFAEAPIGTWMVGYWGHGVNSNAFYYARADSWRQIFFRLFWGGAYGNPEKDATCVRETLESYLRFEEKVKGRVRQLVVVDSMGLAEGHYVTLSGVRIDLQKDDRGHLVFPDTVDL